MKISLFFSVKDVKTLYNALNTVSLDIDYFTVSKYILVVLTNVPIIPVHFQYSGSFYSEASVHLWCCHVSLPNKETVIKMFLHAAWDSCSTWN